MKAPNPQRVDLDCEFVGASRVKKTMWNRKLDWLIVPLVSDTED